MENNNQENLKKKSIKEQLKLIIEGYKIIKDEYTTPVFLPQILASVFNALTPFVNFYFSSLILNELLSNRSKDRLIELVLITISVNFLILILKAILNRWNEYCVGLEYYILRNIYSKKMYSMDYVDIENPKVIQDIEDILLHHTGMGFGLRILLSTFEKLVQSLIKILLAVAIVISLFQTEVPASSPYIFLDSYILVFTFVMFLGISIFLTPYLEIIGGKIFEKAAVVNNKGNRLFMFHTNSVMFNNDKGKDIRIYNQQNLFNTQGFINQEWLKYSSYNAKWCSLANIITNLVSGFVYLYVALKAYAGAFDVGSIVLYVGAITQLVGGFTEFMGNLGKLINNNPFLEKVIDFLNIPNKKYQGTLSVEKREDNEYEIEFKNVSFKYPNTEEYALKNINMKLHIGQKVAIVGMNGSGKSTMIKLLCRLYDVEEGVITLNGIDIRKYDYNEYMEIFAVVFQDFSLLPFTLGQNIATSVDYYDKFVLETIEKAGFSSRLGTLPKGLDTYNSVAFEESGVELSGGEAQKIVLARALYKNAPFIVLDEPTAALDPIAEYEMYSRFNEVVEDKTTIYISHRLSSCRFCDDIIVFDNGELIQRGGHEELILEEEGKYSELWKAQAQYYQ